MVGISQAFDIVEKYHSDPEPSICRSEKEISYSEERQSHTLRCATKLKSDTAD